MILPGPRCKQTEPGRKHQVQREHAVAGRVGKVGSIKPAGPAGTRGLSRGPDWELMGGPRRAWRRESVWVALMNLLCVGTSRRALQLGGGKSFDGLSPGVGWRGATMIPATGPSRACRDGTDRACTSLGRARRRRRPGGASRAPACPCITGQPQRATVERRVAWVAWPALGGWNSAHPKLEGTSGRGAEHIACCRPRFRARQTLQAPPGQNVHAAQVAPRHPARCPRSAHARLSATPLAEARPPVVGTTCCRGWCAGAVRCAVLPTFRPAPCA